MKRMIIAFSFRILRILISAVEWQLFRVSLKGYNTREKLYRLSFRYAYMRSIYQTEDEMEWFRERVRICNYIYALRRGGQLNSNFEVVR
jgi:hypothetical protein